jgi:uncharacterized protein YkwD
MQILKQILLVAVASLMLAAPASAALTSRDLLHVMNETRAQNGLAPLVANRPLARAARSYSQQMLAGGFFDHRNFVERMLRFGIRGPYVGENLAWGAGDSASSDVIVARWLASPAHRKNLLHPRFKAVGLGFATGAFDGVDGATLVTAEFSGR